VPVPVPVPHRANEEINVLGDMDNAILRFNDSSLYGKKENDRKTAS
jgi:hypothetical protein